MKTVIIGLSIACFASISTAHVDPASLILGAVIGSISSEQNHHRQETIIIYEQRERRVPDEYRYSDSNAYCGAYTDTLYARCMGTLKRRQLQEAYEDGLRGR